MNTKPIISFFVIITSFIVLSCDNHSKEKEYLKGQVQLSKKSLPIDMGFPGKFSDIDYINDTITFTFDLSDDAVVYMEQVDSMIDWEDRFWLSASMDKNTAQMIKDIAQADAVLCVEYNYQEQCYYRITFPNQLLIHSNKHLLSIYDASLKYLENESRLLNAMCPHEVERGIQLSRTHIEKDNFVYEYIFDRNYFDFSHLSKKDIEQMKSDVREGLAIDKDTSLRKLVDILINLNKGLCYRYSCNGNIEDIVFSYYELKALKDNML